MNKTIKLINVYNVGKNGQTETPPPPKPDQALRFVCISDTHEHHESLKLPPGDVLLHAGDFSNFGFEDPVKKFAEFLKALPYKHKIIIAGNHDVTFDLEYYETNWKEFDDVKLNAKKIKNYITEVATYLEDSSTTVEGIKIYGSPWQPTFGDWAFNKPRGRPIAQMWEKIPANVDILITHGPPQGHGGFNNKFDLGCSELKIAVENVRPVVHVFGHIHEGYGVSHNQHTTFINAANAQGNHPIVFDVVRIE
eukprot:TRINITY_DN13927_c0_g1_i1.p1 TRINITY_DN13927_c0_g1~~TRINITY_DN13927_c0_g1_i1.p1  ORF type:complete len:251 (+),score=47.65 TRINITY_DN13927_c0_g1_i1:52-804(+)